MTEAAVYDEQRQSNGANWSLWFGLLGGPIIYSFHFLAIYFLAEAACRADLLRYRILGLEAISFWVVVLTVAAALITGYSTFAAYRNWRQLRQAEARDEADRRPGYQRFMAFIGMWLSGIFTIHIVLTGLPALFLVLCDWI